MNFQQTTWPGPPANPCDFTGPDAVTLANLSGLDARHICIDDPSILATQFTSSGSLNTVDFTYNSSDASTHTGGGNLCILYLNFTRVSVAVTYFYCQSPSSTGTLTCRGDGSQPAACPCGNNGLAAHGCANSAAPQGAGLWATGSAAADTVTFFADGLPATALSVLLQGTATLAPGVALGDGLRCAGGILKRLYTHNAVSGALSVPQGADPSVRTRSAQLGDVIPSGATRHYQLWYRDPDPNFCPAPLGNMFNISNGCFLVWP